MDDFETDQAVELAAKLRVKALLSRFSPERPLIVPPLIYWSLEQDPDFADLMNRMKPVNPTPNATAPNSPP
jgi:hypothetical protein